MPLPGMIMRHLAGGPLAHTLKGTLLQCGLDGLAAKAEEIHNGAKNSHTGSSAGILKQIQAGVKKLMEDAPEVEKER
jgi:hypothetical protein